MGMGKIQNVMDVASWRLCSGCGACAPACPEKAIELVDIEDQGIRPVIAPSGCDDCGQCLEACPGIELNHSRFDEQTLLELRESWGPVLEVWEGYASDPQIRFKGSSGGVITALSLYCLEVEKMAGVLHTGNDRQNPLKNIPVFSRTKDDLLSCTGSRYSPASPCEKFGWIEKEQRQSVFVGKPCDVAALRKSQKFNDPLNKQVGLALSFFCAGTPSTLGTKMILKQFNLDSSQVKSFRYRGNGWPGMATATLKEGENQVKQMSYEDSWGKILSKHVQFRCRLCPDSTGEFADISCCDAWYRPSKAGDPGRSLVLVRTEKGRVILRKAIKANYVTLEQAEPFKIAASQPSLLNKRRQLGGRLMAMRLMRVPTPVYKGFSLFTNWRRLPLKAQARSVIGTIVRIVQRKWNKPMVIDSNFDKVSESKKHLCDCK